MTIKELQHAAHAQAVASGFWNPPASLGAQLANMHSELSEAWEEYRAGRPLDQIWYEPNTYKPCGFPIELADVIIRIADTAWVYGIDLEEAIRLKMAFNKTRPFRHGGKHA
jgi:NTP pyrophosphatase (non-canonical NTP hydrolase)